MSSNQQQQPSQLNGQLKSAQGSAYEMVGSLTGSSDWKRSGQQLRTEGDAEVTAAKAQAYAEATGDRVSGKIDNVIGAVTGDRAKQNEGQAKADVAKMRQKANEL